MRIALFITCLADALFPDVGKATVRLLERLGHEVDFPTAQTCCGQMHVNTGYPREALPLVRRYVEAFQGYDAVVAPSGSCVAMVRDSYPRLAAPDRDLGERVEAVSTMTYELSELLVDVLGVTDVGATFPHRVTYHPTCHGLRMLRLGDRPRRLLNEVKGIELVDLEGADECCGFGGTFALKNKDVSAAMLADKCDAIDRTDAEVIAAADNSCLAHIGGGLSRRGAVARPMHYAEILAHREVPA